MRICDNCIHDEVCMYKSHMANLLTIPTTIPVDIADIFKVSIRCKYYLENPGPTPRKPRSLTPKELEEYDQNIKERLQKREGANI